MIKKGAIYRSTLDNSIVKIMDHKNDRGYITIEVIEANDWVSAKLGEYMPISDERFIGYKPEYIIDNRCLTPLWKALNAN